MTFDLLRRIWRRVPISLHRRQRIQQLLFRLLPWVFAKHPAFVAADRDRRRSVASRDGIRPVDRASVTPVPLWAGPALESPPVRLIAFYLPQFHPIPENDAWWGRGFTEWKNVVRAEPQFVGHHQPHLPGELGFYDLRVPEVQARQIELAKLYGIGGFAFYFYWFGGHRLLEYPLLQYLADPRLDLPFCLCWANENWSRRWDGRNNELLIAQHHSPQDDDAFIAYVARYIEDPRYIRVAGRPLLIVYRPDLLPEPKRTAERWRAWCRTHGIGEILLATTQSFDTTDPVRYGFDAAIEFPPNNSHPPVATRLVQLTHPRFEGVVYDWRVFPERSRKYTRPRYMLFRGVNPSWDNEARRPGKGAIFLGSTPAGYREWLENAAADTMKRFGDPSHRLVFVNAWNEWAEGAHLEPDERYGYAYLQATRDALAACRFSKRRDILVVSHDAHRHGAQYLALNLVRELMLTIGYRTRVVLLGGGSLVGEFERLARVHLCEGPGFDANRYRTLAKELHDAGIRDAIVNSVASGLFVAPLREAGIRVISLIHELPNLIRNQGLVKHTRIISAHADIIVFPAAAVRTGFERFAVLPPEKVVVRPQGLYKRNKFAGRVAQARSRANLRRRLALSENVQIVLGVGYGDERKGFDLFVQSGIAVCQARGDVVFLWVGALDKDLEMLARRQITAAGLDARFALIGHEQDTDMVFAGSDVYALTSREDPFPSVVLEALEVGLPVVAFAGAGGIASLAGHPCVSLVPRLGTSDYGASLIDRLDDAIGRVAVASAGRTLIQREFGFRRYVLDLLSLSSDPPPRVSVVVPNYNYRRYLPERIASINAQTYPVYEIIVLDDGSTDGSREWLEEELLLLCPEAQLLVSDKNSGSVFGQWLKGAALARGDVLWIAEADDLSEPDFVAEALKGLDDPTVVLSYTQSKQISAQGAVLCDDYLDYVSDLSPARWRHAYVADGIVEISRSLAVKNTIPNISATLIRAQILQNVLRSHIDELTAYRVAGDWLTYVEILKNGRIAYCPKPLNLHRRHASGATLSSFNIQQLNEILSIQKRIRDEFPVEPGTERKATEYAQSLYEQFGIATRRIPRIHDHPELRRYLRT